MEVIGLLRKKDSKHMLFQPGIGWQEVEFQGPSAQLGVFLVFELDSSTILSCEEVSKKSILALGQQVISLGSSKSALLPELNGFLQEHVVPFAAHIACDMVLNSPTTLRFNNDADGVSGGLALSLIPGEFIQHNSPIYSTYDAGSDISQLSNSENSKVILVDFGCGEESLDGLMMLKDNGIKLDIVDHHPMDEASRDYAHILNTHGLLGRPEVTAGYAAVELARALSLIDDQFAIALAGMSFSGDKSPLLSLLGDPKAHEKRAVAVDHWASDPEQKKTLDAYRALVLDLEQQDTVYHDAIQRKDSMKEEIAKFMKVEEKDGFSIITLPLHKIDNAGNFPSKGKLCNACLEMTDPSKPAVILGVMDKKIIFRLTKAAIAKGLGASKVIEALKQKDLIVSGGGHDVAATVTFHKELGKEVLRTIKGEFSK